MNDQSSRTNDDIDVEKLDRLVDGTLDLDQQRELLTQLDEIPDGWRRCALTFLEAQTWRQEFRLIQASDGWAAPSILPAGPAAIVSRQSQKPSLVARLVSVALALCVAFGLGRLSRPVAPQRQDEVVRAPDGSSPSEPAEEPVLNHERSTIAGSQAPRPDATDDIRVAAQLSWHLQQDGEKRKVEVPVLEGPGLDMQWVMQQPTAVQESIRKALEQRGHKVESQRQLLTVGLKDGRSVVVPIDQVQVKFAKRIFQ